MTTAQINSMAQNVVNFLNQYGIDGIDFDVEVAVDGAQLQQLIQTIKSVVTSCNYYGSSAIL